VDNDASIISLFNTAVGGGFVAWLAYGSIRLLKIRPLFNFATQYALLEKTAFFLKRLKALVNTGR
jgi:hypothetical protein